MEPLEAQIRSRRRDARGARGVEELEVADGRERRNMPKEKFIADY